MGFSGRGKLVSELDSISSLADTDIVQISSGNVFKKMTIAQLKEQLGINALNTNLQSIFSAERNDNDYNLITTPGFYNCTSASHTPFTTGEWTVMLVLNYPGSTVAQIAFSVSTGKSAVRIGATSAWKTF